jgi:hypothetical protein
LCADMFCIMVYVVLQCSDTVCSVVQYRGYVEVCSDTLCSVVQYRGYVEVCSDTVSSVVHCIDVG